MQGLTVPAEEANWAAAGDAIVTAPHRNGRDTTIAQIVARFVRESGRMQQLVAVVVVPTRAMATSMKVLLEFALSERVAVLVGGSGNKNGESLRGTRVAVVTMTKFAMLADDGRIRTDEVGMLVLVEANELVVKATSGGAPWTLESFWMLFPALQRRLAFSEFYAGSSVAKLRQLMNRPRSETLRLDG